MCKELSHTFWQAALSLEMSAAARCSGLSASPRHGQHAGGIGCQEVVVSDSPAAQSQHAGSKGCLSVYFINGPGRLQQASAATCTRIAVCEICIQHFTCLSVGVFQAVSVLSGMRTKACEIQANSGAEKGSSSELLGWCTLRRQRLGPFSPKPLPP